jgi:hypothetical protein
MTGDNSADLREIVSRHFGSLFFIRQFHLVPIDMPRKVFELAEYSRSYSYSQSTHQCIHCREVETPRCINHCGVVNPWCVHQQGVESHQ